LFASRYNVKVELFRDDVRLCIRVVDAVVDVSVLVALASSAAWKNLGFWRKSFSF